MVHEPLDPHKIGLRLQDLADSVVSIERFSVIWQGQRW